MLRVLLSISKPNFQGSQTFLGVFLLVCWGWLDCWVILGQQEGNPQRIAKPATYQVATIEKLSSKPNSGFSKMAAETIPFRWPAEGFFSIRMTELMSHPQLIPHQLGFQHLLNRMLECDSNGQPRNTSDFGFTLCGIEIIESPMVLNFSRIPLEQRTANGESQSLSISLGSDDGSNVLRITMDRVVEWASLLSLVNFAALDVEPSYVDAIRQVASKLEPSQTFSFSRGETSQKVNQAELSDCEISIWQDVRGGVATAFTRLPTPKIRAMLAEPNPQRDQQPLELAIWQLACEVRSIGIGFDFVWEEEAANQQDQDFIRISMEPTGSIESLVTRCQQLQATALRLLHSSAESALASETLSEWMDAISQIQIQPIYAPTGSRVIVTARLPLIRLLVAR